MFQPAFTNPRRTLWATAGIVLFALIASTLKMFIGPLLVGLFLYYSARPVYRRIEPFVDQASLAAAVSMLFFVVPGMTLLGYALLIVLQELVQFAVTYDLSKIEGLVGTGVITHINDLKAIEPERLVATAMGESGGVLAELMSAATSSDGLATIQSIWNSAVSVGTLTATIALQAFIALTVAFYLLRDDDRLAEWVSRFESPDNTYYVFWTRVDRDLGAIFFGNLLNAFITAVIAVIIYTILAWLAPPSVSVSYPALIGLLAGMFSLVPVVGMKLVYWPMTGYLLLSAVNSDSPGVLWFPAVFFGVSLVLVDALPDLFLRPYVSGKNIHIGALMLAYILGSAYFGWYGLFLGPMILVLGYHFADLILPPLLTPVE